MLIARRYQVQFLVERMKNTTQACAVRLTAQFVTDHALAWEPTRR